MAGLASIPRWLEVLLAKEFFNSCLVHEAEKKNEENTLCLDCCTGLCSHCLPPHKAHNLLQIRRYVYQDVLRLSDAYKLMDCSSVQPYKTNSTKVVFLNQRPMTRQFKGSGNSCITCYRNLQDPNLFCSISCKVHHMVNNTKSGSTREENLYERESLLALPCAQMTPETVLKLPAGKKRRSIASLPRIGCGAVCLPAAEITAAMNRRKGVPRRSPLY